MALVPLKKRERKRMRCKRRVKKCSNCHVEEKKLRKWRERERERERVGESGRTKPEVEAVEKTDSESTKSAWAMLSGFFLIQRWIDLKSDWSLFNPSSRPRNGFPVALRSSTNMEMATGTRHSRLCDTSTTLMLGRIPEANIPPTR
jgi:hypothetical protein